MSWSQTILIVVIYVEYTNAKGSGLMNEYAYSRKIKDPEIIWTMDPVNHDTQRSSGIKYAELRNVDFMSSGDLGWDFYHNYHKNGLISFPGSSGSFVYIDNTDNLLDGSKGMTWVFEIHPSNRDGTTTILKYQKDDGQTTFHLKLLPDKSLSCSMTDATGKTHDFTSNFTIQNDSALFGVTYNCLWTDQHFRFVLYEDTEVTHFESHSLGSLEVELDLVNSFHVTVGTSFVGNMSCIMFYPLSLFLVALDEAPLNCDPNTFSSDLVDHTIIPYMTTPVQTTEDSLTTTVMVMSTQPHSTAVDITTSDSSINEFQNTVDHTIIPYMTTLVQTTEDSITTTVTVMSTQPHPTAVDITTSDSSINEFQNTGAMRVEENCSTFVKSAENRCLSLPETVKTVSTISTCADWCSRSGSCECFSARLVGGMIECSTASTVSSKATTFLFGCSFFCLG